MKSVSIPASVAASPTLAGRKILWRACAKAASRIHEIHWAEFGVRKGKSANFLLGLLPPGIGKLHLFDSWEGLPEEWHRGPGETSPVGQFKYKMPRWGDGRVIMHPGLFEDTLDVFRADNPHMTLNLAHIDCDLYSSTATVLESLRTMFSHGTILIFDDLFGYPFWRDGQWKAWQEWIGNLPHTWIAHTPKGQAAVRLDGSW